MLVGFIVAVAADGVPVCDGPRAGVQCCGARYGPTVERRGSGGGWCVGGGAEVLYTEWVLIVFVLLFAKVSCGWIAFSYSFGGLLRLRFCWHGVVRLVFRFFRYVLFSVF